MVKNFNTITHEILPVLNALFIPLVRIISTSTRRCFDVGYEKTIESSELENFFVAAKVKRK